MHAKALRVQEALHALGVRSEVRELPDTTRSAGEAADAIGTTVAQIAKSLVFATPTRTVLAIASGVNRVEVERLAGALGEPVQRPDAKAVKRLTGYSVGGIPPVGHDAPPATFLDEDLLAHDTIWAAAGTPHAVFPIAPADLVRVTGATVMPLAR